MRPLPLLPALALLLAGLVAAPAVEPAPAVGKKGIGLAERTGLGAHQLDLLKVSWYYNWGPETKLTHHAQFVPMMFSTRTAPPHRPGEFILGYNEPDNAKQSDLPVKDALRSWPEVTGRGRTVVSPAMAGNPLTGDWLPDFMKAKPKVDAIAVHWYKGVDPKHLIRDLEEIHAAYKKPVWLTEFAPQTNASSEEKPDKFTQAQVNTFITESLDFLEKTPWVQRYAWHNAKTGTSALLDAKGELTASGRAYAAHR